MTTAPCRRRTGEALPRAEKFVDLITAGHKVLNEEGESPNNDQHAVVVQDLATQWNTQRTRWNLGKHVRVYHGIIELRHLIDPRQLAALKVPYEE